MMNSLIPLEEEHRYLELRMARAMGKRPDYSEAELAAMGREMRQAFLAIPVRSPAKHRANRKEATDVYRFYDADGGLLYVGLSMNVAQRFGQHRDSPFWNAVVRIEREKFPDRDAASVRERDLIANHRPIFNRNAGGA